MTGYLLLREVALLAVMLAFGAGFVSLLPRELPAGIRWALAPGAGVAIGSGVLMTVDFIVPLRHALWFVVVPAAVLSTLLALRGGLGLPRVAHVAGILVVFVVALGMSSYAYVERDSPGPAAYGIFDAPGYIGEIASWERFTNRSPVLGLGYTTDWGSAAPGGDAWGAPWNLADRQAWALRWQHVASTALASVTAGGFGWLAWTMLAAFFAALLAAGALGCWALAGTLGAPPGLQVLAGVLYSGPLTYTISIDGSLGMIAALAVIPVVLVTAIVAIERFDRRRVVMAGTALGGLLGVYPEIFAVVLGALALPLIAITLLRVRRRRPSLRQATETVGVVAAGTLAALLVSPRTLPWTWDYLLGSPFNLGSLVPYQMRLEHLPGWVYQTREFYSFAFADPAGAQESLIGLALPLALIAVSAYGAVRHRRARWLLGIPVAAVLQAWVTQGQNCSYCTQRSLLVLAPVAPALLAVGLAALAAQGRLLRDGAVALAAVAAVAIASTALASVQRAREGAVFAPRQLESAADAAARVKTPGPVLLEGMGTAPFTAWLDLRSAYYALDERSGRRISVAPNVNEWGGLTYFAARSSPDHPAWDPAYANVMTRYGNLDDGRRRVASHPPYFVRQRAQPFDVTIVGGVATDTVDRDPGGTVWVQPEGTQLGFTQGPLSLWVAASSKRTAYLRIRLQGPPGMKVGWPKGTPPVTRQRQRDNILSICRPMPGPAATRRAQFYVAPTPPLLSPPLRRFENAPQPGRTIAVTSARASTKPC